MFERLTISDALGALFFAVDVHGVDFEPSVVFSDDAWNELWRSAPFASPANSGGLWVRLTTVGTCLGSFHKCRTLLRKLSKTIRVWKWRVLYNLKFDYVFQGYVTSVISGQTIFDFPTSILISFTIKSYLRSETHIAYKFYALTTKQLFFRREFLFVRRKRHRVLDPFFSYYQVMGVGLVFT